jgi:predicted MPP superfamily phosphohydrolase
MIKDLINEFKKRHNVNFNIQQYLLDFEEGFKIKELAERHNVRYDAIRYLNYLLRLKSTTLADRLESVEILRKNMANEEGNDYDVIHKLDTEISALVKENSKLRKSLILQQGNNTSLRREIRELVREEDSMLELKEIILEGMSTVTLPNLPFNLVNRKMLKNSDIQPFALLSDLHYNEIVKGQYINEYNEFDNEICLQGIDKVLEEVQQYGGDVLRLYLGGDLLSGLLHGLDKKGQVPVTQSVIELGKFLADRINKLSTQYKEIKVIQVSGNHERLKEKPVLDTKSFDFAHLMYEIMVSNINANNVDTHYAISTFAIDNVGTEDNPKYVVLFHGDNKSFNPTSSSTVLKQFAIFDELFGVKVTSTLSGHTHNPVFAPNSRGGSCIVNGCMSGSNEYGFNANFVPIQPYQWIGTWNKLGYADDIKCIKIR